MSSDVTALGKGAIGDRDRAASGGQEWGDGGEGLLRALLIFMMPEPSGLSFKIKPISYNWEPSTAKPCSKRGC